MHIDDLRRHWDRFGKLDPLFAILTVPGKEGNKWQRDEFFATGRSDIASLLGYMENIGLSPNRGRALDFGCGIGRLTEALADRFAQVDGVDISREMISAARGASTHPNATYHLNERADLSLFPAASFDFVYSYIVLHHMEPRYIRAYVGEFLRILRDDGLAVFHLPYALRARRRRERLKHFVPWLFSLYGKLRRGHGAVMEIYTMPKDEVRDLVASLGGRVVHIEDGVGTPEMPGARYYVRGDPARSLSGR